MIASHAETFSEPRDAHVGREGFWAYGLVTPSRSDDSTSKTVDATRLSFPLQLVIVIGGGIIATVGAFWLATSSLRSDVRDILTRMESQSTLQEERWRNLKSDVDQEKRDRQLQKYDGDTRIKELETRIKELESANRGRR